MRIDTNRAAAIHFRCGSSGSGKSWSVKEAIKKASRLCIFDPDDEYGEISKIVTVKKARELLDLLGRHPKGALKIRFVANGKEAFNLWAKAVFTWGCCVAVAEEIAGVTSPSKAPPGWHTLISRGRKRGIVLYAVTQRPAECDKTILGNATTIRTGRLARADDRKYLAKELDIPVVKVNALENLDFIERNLNDLTVHQGRMGTKLFRKIT